MICPACGHDNLPGQDECERCQVSLQQEDTPHNNYHRTAKLYVGTFIGSTPHNRFECRLQSSDGELRLLAPPLCRTALRRRRTACVS